MLTNLLMVGGVLFGQVEQITPGEFTLQVRRLVSRLDSDELARRETAEKALIELGPDVLDHLPKTMRYSSPEVEQRLRRIQEVLQRAGAERETQASLVSLPSQTMPLSGFVAALKEQTGNQLVDFRQRWGQQVDDMDLKVDFDKVPFWQALDQTLDQIGLTLYHYPGQQNAVAYVRGEAGLLPRSKRAAYNGVFRIEPTAITSTRNLRRPAADTLNLTLEISWEPRLTPISLSQSLADIRVVDDRGNALAVASEEGSLESPVRGGVSAVEMELPLAMPPRNVQRIATLSGQLIALVPGRVEAFEFDKLADARDTEIRKGGVTVVLQTVRKNVSVHEVRMIVRFDEAANALESHRGWIFNNEAYLLDADGEKVEDAGYETIRQTPNEVGMAFKYALEEDLDKYRFVYKTPAAIVRMPVKYELKDIALP